MKKSLLVILLTIAVSLSGFAQSITVTSPAGTDSWEIGSSHNIIWTKSGTMNGNVKIRLYNESGSVRILGITDSTANNGMFRNWVIPESVPAGRYVIRVKTVDNLVSDESEPFTIFESSVPTGRLEVTFPNSSTVVNTTQYWLSVSWNDYGDVGENVSIEVFPEGSSTGATLIVALTPNDNEYHWMSPGAIGVGRYYLRVSTPDGSIYDDSEVFEVVDPTPPPPTGSISITSPGSSANWNVGTNRQIVWSLTGEMNDRVKIKIYNEAGTIVTLNITDSTENDGLHIFPLPSTHPEGRFLIRIATVDDLVMATSEIFTITRPDDAISTPRRNLKFIKIISPEKNSVYKTGDYIKIVWEKTGILPNRVKIELKEERSFRALTIVSDTGNNGTYKWKIPAGIPEGKYTIKITTLRERTTGISGLFRIKTKLGRLLFKK